MLNTGISDSSDATAITIDSSENVTIGTVGSGASTATPVELNLGSTFADGVGNAKTKLKLFEDSSANVYGFGVSNNLLEYHVAASGEHAFYVNDSEKVRIDSNGQVMISHSSSFAHSDADNLAIGDGTNNSGLTIYTGASKESSIIFGNAGTNGNIEAGIKYYHESHGTVANRRAMTFATGGSMAERMRIDSSGNVGIGTTSPTTHLSVANSGFTNTSTTGIPAIRAEGSYGGAIGLLDTKEAGWYAQDSGDTLYQYVGRASGTAANASIVMTYKSSGNVGIGTTAPSQKFEVFPDDDHAAIIGRARVGNVGYSDFAGFSHLDSGDEYAILQQNNGHTYVNAASGEDISFRISNSDKMQLLSNGRVVIGTGTSSNAGLLVSNADIRCTAAAVANDGNSISMSQESSGGFIVARGAHTSSRGTINLHVAASNGGIGITGLTVANDGSVSKYSGSFKIDHPLESKKDTHHLVHSFVEGPQADNIYRGVIALENGSATINLDTVSGMTEGTFVALNTNTSCFTSNETDWDSVKGSISGNTLTISCQNTSSTATVSWLVIGERHDQHMMDANWTDDSGKVIVEPLKESNFSFLKESE